VLRNPVPVEALYDRRAAHRVTFRNLLQRQGCENLDAVRAEGVAQGVVTVLESRGPEPDENARERILGCKDPELLRRWLVRAANVTRIEDLFAD
jgi:hypothetical protein